MYGCFGKISDSRTLPNWYQLARSIIRKILFHAVPTNSRKTYHALKLCRKAKSGLYCGPLKPLKYLINTPYDLVTGEERLFTNGKKFSIRTCCMYCRKERINAPCAVAVIDEIQLIKDYARGWAWIRALLSMRAEEIHLCGVASAIDLVRTLCLTTGDIFDVNNKRLTKLEIQNKTVVTYEKFNHIQYRLFYQKYHICSIKRAKNECY
ncbi:hypothetical protein HCN44_010986 [Aphidius gifuensis]|uniref:ATP-dependent RNA helicase SUV3 DEXQ-box helicase domain-containing protein n=1 Tax=Aphidius gifuensis TaxID=684658 RepID=A0A834Y3C7_APHGI|nr:hypothetical protein HCN44_010986 [Aphidius gifuensis]